MTVEELAELVEVTEPAWHRFAEEFYASGLIFNPGIPAKLFALPARQTASEIRLADRTFLAKYLQEP